MKEFKFFVLGLLVYPLAFILKALKVSIRYETFDRDLEKKAMHMHPGGGYCLAIWHEHLLVSALSQWGRPFGPLISQSKDGDFIAAIVEKFGFFPIRGSSSRGGSKAKNELKKVMSKGRLAGITLDGPRGPRQVAKKGIIDISKTTGTPILPLIVLAKKNWVFKKSWDHFRFPKPFVAGVVQYGEPFVVPADTAIEDYPIWAKKLENTLKETQILAEKRLASIS